MLPPLFISARFQAKSTYTDSHVRRGDKVVQIHQTIHLALLSGLMLEHIARRCSDRLARLECLTQGTLIHHGPTAHVDQYATAFHHRQLGGADEATRLGCEWAVEAYDVA